MKKGYIYKISFPNGCYYIGSKIGSPGESPYYFGSPVTNKEVWKKYPIKCKEILRVYEDYYNSTILEVESKLIKQFINDPFCLNCNYSEAIIQTDKVKANRVNTNLKKYGKDHPMKNEEVYAQHQQTMIEKYGVDSPLKDEVAYAQY